MRLPGTRRPRGLGRRLGLRRGADRTRVSADGDPGVGPRRLSERNGEFASSAAFRCGADERRSHRTNVLRWVAPFRRPSPGSGPRGDSLPAGFVEDPRAWGPTRAANFAAWASVGGGGRSPRCVLASARPLRRGRGSRRRECSRYPRRARESPRRASASPATRASFLARVQRLTWRSRRRADREVGCFSRYTKARGGSRLVVRPLPCPSRCSVHRRRRSRVTPM